MKTIIVATDFSEAAENAAYYAADMALRIPARILLLNVFQVSPVFYEIPVAGFETEMRSDADDALWELRAKLLSATNHDLSVDTEIYGGIFYESLFEICEKVSPYAVVMGSQGTTAANRLLFGSHSIFAMRNLPWPVITVPQHTDFSEIKKICIAFNPDQKLSSYPIETIHQFASDFNAELHVVYSGQKDQPDRISEPGSPFAALLPLNPKFHLVADSRAEERIILFAEENKMDLLIAFPRHYGFLEQLIHKSTTKQLILKCRVPVMALQA